MEFSRQQNADFITWTVEIQCPDDRDTIITDPIAGTIAVNVSNDEATEFPVAVGIGDSDVMFSTDKQLEEIISSPSELPVKFSFEIPAGIGRPSIQLRLNDSGDLYEKTVVHLSYAEPIHLSSRILQQGDTDSILELIEETYGNKSLASSSGLRGDIEYFVSFEQYVRITDFLFGHSEDVDIVECRTIMKRVIKQSSPYTAESLADLREKVDRYSSSPNLSTISVADVIIEHIHDVLATSQEDTIDSLDEISSRLGIDDNWSLVLQDDQLGLLLGAYCVFEEESRFESLLATQSSSELPDFDAETPLEYIASLLFTTAENTFENVHSASLYDHAATVYERIEDTENAAKARVLSHIHTGYQASSEGQYEQARIHFRQAAEAAQDDSELQGRFMQAVRNEAEVIQQALEGSTDEDTISSAHKYIEEICSLISQHPSVVLDGLNEVVEARKTINDRFEDIETDQDTRTTSDKEEDQDNTDVTATPPKTVDREYTEVYRVRRDPLFEKNVKQAYSNTCAVCGSQRQTPDGRPEVEAAHIRPAGSDDGPDSIKNGLALCKLHHWAFDNGWIAISDDYRILVRDVPHVNGYPEFSEYDGEELILPDNNELYPGTEFLQFHRQKHGF